MSKKIDFDFDFDFGFSSVPAEEVLKSTEVEQLQADLLAEKEKTEAVINAIMPLLNNLAKNPENEYIFWPDRVSKIEQFKKKLMKLR